MKYNSAFNPISLEKIEPYDWIKENPEDNIIVILEINDKEMKLYALKKSYFIAPVINDVYLKCVIENHTLDVKKTFKSKHNYRNIGFYLNHKLLIDNKEFIKNLNRKKNNVFKISYNTDKEKEYFVNLDLLQLSKIEISKKKDLSKKNFPIKKYDIYFDKLISEALYNYSYQWYQPINRYLLEGDKYFYKEEFYKYYKRYGSTIEIAIQNVLTKIKLIDKCFLELAPRYINNKKQIFYRGMKGPYYINYDEKIKADKIGDNFIVTNFTSITSSLGIARSFSKINTTGCCLYEIYLDENLPYIDMKLTTKYKGEKEFLLPRNIKFEITDIIPTHIYDKNYNKYVLKASSLHKDQFKFDTGCRLFHTCNIKPYKLLTNKESSSIKKDKSSSSKKEIVLKEQFNKIKRCPKGTRRNKITRVCESKDKIQDIQKSLNKENIQPNKNIKTIKTMKTKRCPNGTRKNKKTGLCEPK